MCFEFTLFTVSRNDDKSIKTTGRSLRISSKSGFRAVLCQEEFDEHRVQNRVSALRTMPVLLDPSRNASGVKHMTAGGRGDILTILNFVVLLRVRAAFAGTSSAGVLAHQAFKTNAAACYWHFLV